MTKLPLVHTIKANTKKNKIERIRRRAGRVRGGAEALREGRSERDWDGSHGGAWRRLEVDSTRAGLAENSAAAWVTETQRWSADESWREAGAARQNSSMAAP